MRRICRRFVAPPVVVAKPVVLPFSGPYFGVLVGYGFGTTSVDPTTRPTSWSAPDIHPRGWLFGGTIGTNWQNNNHVFGLEADAAWANLSGTGGWNEDDSTGNPWNSKTSTLATIRARFGVP